MEIKNLVLREIFDSRGESTIEIELQDETGGTSRSQVPSGKSRGSRESVVLSYEESQKNWGEIVKNVTRRNWKNIAELDQSLIKLDGTENKKRLGGNVILGISAVFTRRLAAAKNMEIWQVLREEFFEDAKEKRNPVIFSNLINGGSHASNNLNIQEYLVLAESPRSIKETIRKLIEIYKKLGDLLRKEYNAAILPIGDEGGYSPNFKSNFEPIEILEKLIFKSGLEKVISVGLDAAATNFEKNGKYLFEENKMNREELLAIYKDYFKRSKPLRSIEDPFSENDFEGFKQIKNTSRETLIVGDDLTATNPTLIKKFAADGLIGAVIIKPNQIGTLSETCEAINAAGKNGLKCIISHRSGETEDNLIIHLAKASGAYGVKIGAPTRERIAKFNELIRIYE